MFSQTPPVTSRNISLATIRDAAAIVYEAAVRTPLVRLDLGSKATDAAAQVGSPLEIFLKLETLQPIGSFKIRGAYNAVRQLTADQLAQGVWTVSAGNAAQGVALAARKVGRRGERAGDGHRSRDQAPRDRTARRHASCRRPTTNAGARSRPTAPTACRGTSSIRSTMIASSAATARLAWRSSRICPTWMRSSRRSAAAACSRASPARCAPCVPRRASTPPSRRPPRRWRDRSHAGRASRFDEWEASFVDGAGGRSVLDSMWPLLRDSVTDSIVVSLEEVARAMALAADRVHVIAEGAAGCAIAAALSPGVRPARPSQSRRRSSRAATSICRASQSWWARAHEDFKGRISVDLECDCSPAD